MLLAGSLLLCFDLILVILHEFLNLGVDDQHAVRLVGVAVIIVFMIVLSRIKVGEGGNFRDYRLLIQMGLLQGRLRVQGGLALLIIVVVDGRAILCTHIVALTIKRRWIMRVPEHVQQLLIGDNGGIICYLIGFCRTSSARTHLLIGGMRNFRVGIARHDRDHALEPLEDRLCTPEAATGQGCCFKLRHYCTSLSTLSDMTPTRSFLSVEQDYQGILFPKVALLEINGSAKTVACYNERRIHSGGGLYDVFYCGTRPGGGRVWHRSAVQIFGRWGGGAMGQGRHRRDCHASVGQHQLWATRS